MRNKLLSVVSVLAVFAGTASARQQPDVQPSEPESTAKQPSKLPAMDSPALDAAHGGSAASCGGDCSTPDCGCEPPCGPPGRLWVDAEYLLWWTKSARVPPLVTSGTTSSAGILGREGTVVLVGNSGLDENPRSGLRIGGGFWLDDCHTLGLEGSYFFLGQRSSDSSFAGSGAPGTPVLARPFFNVITGAQDSEIDSFPNVASGTKLVHFSSLLQGAEANAIYNLCCCGDWCGCGSGHRVDLLAGFRYLQLDENLEIRETLSVFPTVPVIGGTSFNIVDQFRTRNHFYGGQIGARGEIYRNGFFVDVIGKVALGGTDGDINVSGATQIISPNGTSVIRPGGLLAQTTNIGHFEKDDFAVVPEFTINVGYQVNCHVRAYVGYTLLYWSSVFRPGDQIDFGLNPNLFPTNGTGTNPTGPARPAPVLKDTDFWAQGINFGLEFRY